MFFVKKKQQKSRSRKMLTGRRKNRGPTWPPLSQFGSLWGSPSSTTQAVFQQRTVESPCYVLGTTRQLPAFKGQPALQGSRDTAGASSVAQR